MYTLYKFHFLNGISEINQLFDDILIIWPAPVYLIKPEPLPLKESYDAISCFPLSLECYKLCVHI